MMTGYYSTEIILTGRVGQNWTKILGLNFHSMDWPEFVTVVQNSWVDLLIFRVDELFIHLGTWLGPFVTKTK